MNFTIKENKSLSEKQMERESYDLACKVWHFWEFSDLRRRLK